MQPPQTAGASQAQERGAQTDSSREQAWYLLETNSQVADCPNHGAVGSKTRSTQRPMLYAHGPAWKAQKQALHHFPHHRAQGEEVSSPECFHLHHCSPALKVP
jgi:hypothetical protein